MTSTNEIEKMSPVASLLKTDTKGRLRISRENREEILREYDGSSMSAAAFAKWTGIKYTTMTYWLQARRKSKEKEKRGSTKDLKWVEAVASDAVGSVKSSVIINIGSIRIEAVDGRSAAEVLRELGVKVC